MVYTREAIQSLEKKLKKRDYHDNEKRIFLEGTIYSIVGIFCTSSFTVFENDAAQVMFAHYGDDLKGLALIYEHENFKENIFKIDYKSFRDQGDSSIAPELLKGNFNKDSLKNFLNKSCGWEYEQEYRKFSYLSNLSDPRLKSACEHNLKLKGILYTTRFDQSKVKSLEFIKNKVYEDRIFLMEIFASVYKDRIFLYSN